MSFFDILNVFLPLILIVALLYLVLRLVKKYGGSMGKNLSGSRLIRVVGMQMIMPKKYISLVKIDNKLLLLGISENSITLLKELDPAHSEIENPPADSISQGNNFLELLKKNIGFK